MREATCLMCIWIVRCKRGLLGCLGKGWNLCAQIIGGRCEINQLLFADDEALTADSEEKLLLLGCLNLSGQAGALLGGKACS